MEFFIEKPEKQSKIMSLWERESLVRECWERHLRKSVYFVFLSTGKLKFYFKLLILFYYIF